LVLAAMVSSGRFGVVEHGENEHQALGSANRAYFRRSRIRHLHRRVDLARRGQPPRRQQQAGSGRASRHRQPQRADFPFGFNSVCWSALRVLATDINQMNTDGWAILPVHFLFTFPSPWPPVRREPRIGINPSFRCVPSVCICLSSVAKNLRLYLWLISRISFVSSAPRGTILRTYASGCL
jgi:hypothetical protein